MKLLKTIVLYCILLSFGNSLSAKVQDTIIIIPLTYSIQSAYDDMEELSSGQMLPNSTDIELSEDPDNGGSQTIGLHFSGIQIPQGAIIQNASIQFQTDEISNGNCSIQIYGEAADNANSFSNTVFNITNRTLTTQSVNWSPLDWWIQNEANDAQRTSNLTNIVQEIIDRPNWQEGNAINFIMNGSGRRVAHAYEGNQSNSAKLNIEVAVPVLDDNLSQIYINELMAKNNVIDDEYGEKDDWIELYNANDTSVLLTGLYLSDDANDRTKWQIEGALVIPPNSFSVFWLDDQVDQGTNHAPFKLSSSGESLFLSQEQAGELVLLDEITFGNLPENVSYGRETDGNSNWVSFGEYSPKESNNGNGLYLNATITFSVESGSFNTSFPLSISCSDPSAQIRITTDGSTPTLSSTLYTGQFFIDQTSLLRAAAFKQGYASSPQKDAFYLIGSDHELPVIQLSIDSKYLWDEQEGMYVTGANGITGFCSNDIPRNWNQDWERPATVRYFEPDGSMAFQLNAGMKIGGGCSRGYALKMFNLFFREQEYGDDIVDYPLFENFDVNTFKRFKLRGSGTDYPLTMIRDATIQSLLFNQVDIDLMAYTPAVVYLNGDYWGFYGIREFFTKHYVEAHHGVSQDNIDLLKNPYYTLDVREGDANDWLDLTDFIRTNSFTNQDNMDELETRVDINEFINYHIAQIYVVNYDWPANNVSVWRDRNNGRWRWMLFDTDISSGFGQWSPALADYDAINHATTTSGNLWPNGEASTLFLRKMLNNQEFKNEFTQRTCTFAQTIFAPDRTLHFIDSLSARIDSEVPQIVTKFNNPPSNWVHWGDNPVGGSYFAWKNHLSNFINFFNIRFPYVLNNFESHFSYNGHFDLNINYDAETPGTVVFHNNEMPIPYQYEAQYFNNVPIEIKAIADEGYHFVRWEETGDTTTTINFAANTTSVLTPIFQKDGEVDPPPPPPPSSDPESVFQIYPIPSNTILTIKYGELTTTRFLIRIYNSIGQQVFIKELEAGPVTQELEIDVQEWANGVYFLETIFGEEEILKKLVIHH